MSLARKTIRHAVRNLLRAGNTLAGTRVFAANPDRLGRLGLPAIAVWTRNEPVQVWSTAPREYLHLLEVLVELFVEEASVAPTGELLELQPGEIAAALADELGEQVQRILHANTHLPNVPDSAPFQLAADQTRLERVETDEDEAGGQIIGAIRQTWTFAYVTQQYEEAPEPLTNLELVHADFDLVGVGEPVDLEAEVTLQE